MKISFLSTSHTPLDDRIFHHMAKSTQKARYQTEIITSNSAQKEIVEGVSINSFNSNNLSKRNKISEFVNILEQSKPDIIICSEPLAILSAKRYKKTNKSVKIIYDVTEWYPSKKNLSKSNLLMNSMEFIKLLLFNYYVSSFTDAFIFGEIFKSYTYRLLFPLKPKAFISYFPNKEYLQSTPPNNISKNINFCYSGKISIEKGFENFVKVVKKIKEDNPTINVTLKIIGWLGSENYKIKYENIIDDIKEDINLIFIDKLEFHEYISEIKDTDVFLDLRSDDLENQLCLPIKLFYYSALGRPVIFSNLKAIKKEVEIEKFGFLVNPTNIKETTSHINNYIKNRKLYVEHCEKAEELFLNKNNWDSIEGRFINFLKTINNDI